MELESLAPNGEDDFFCVPAINMDNVSINIQHGKNQSLILLEPDDEELAKMLGSALEPIDVNSIKLSMAGGKSTNKHKREISVVSLSLE